MGPASRRRPSKSPDASAKVAVPLTIHFPKSELPQRPLPVAGGVPLARGLVRQVEDLSIWKQGTEKVPANLRPSATWPDGSVKWVFCQFLATPGRAMC